MQEHPMSWRQAISTTLARHLAFMGPGLIASVAYCDPGNWATDMEAGSRFGYSLLFTVLLSGLFAVLLQVLCCRLGTVTGMDLAVQTRRLVLGLPPDSDEVPDWSSPKTKARFWGILIPLYIINEGAIVATELAELIGSAIALNLLFPSLPLWGGVLVTSADVFLVLFLYRPSMSVRIFEMFIGALVMIVLACFIVLIVRVSPDWGDVFYGFVPSHQVIESGGLYVSISILGATIMPHSLVLGSHFATIDRLDGANDTASDAGSDIAASDDREGRSRDAGAPSPAQAPADSLPAAPGKRKLANRGRSSSIWRMYRSAYHRVVAKHIQVPEVLQDDRLPHQPPAALKHVRLHLQHASWDIAICLVLFAITINSAILIVASAGFYYGNNRTGDTEVVGDLFQAHRLLRDTVGKVPAALFAIALLTAGQSSSITVTLAGQIISEGFIHWRLTPFMRRLITRAIAVIPAMAVAAVAGRAGLDRMLVASQVALSMALPFVSLPLLLLTGSSRRMSREVIACVPATNTPASSSYGATAPAKRSSAHESALWRVPRKAVYRAFRFLCCIENESACEEAGPTYAHAFHNSLLINLLSWAVFGLICVADVYVLYATLNDPSSAH